MEKNATILTTKLRLRADKKAAFADWQSKLNALIAHFPGFISLEILSPQGPCELDWVINQRFNSTQDVYSWRQLEKRQKLIEELQSLCDGFIEESEIHTTELPQGGVTEVFITEVSPDNDNAFKEWIAKMHQVEAKFPGFRGVYVQSPGVNEGKNWMTFLQFDSPENLDRWLNSPERQAVLKESTSLIASIESHRVITSYAGWFSSIAKDGELPPVWKQTMLVLLVLYPIVMLELKYLMPITDVFNKALSIFMNNALSVMLISWPAMPLAILALGWWLAPTSHKMWKTVAGTLLVLLLYAFEVYLFWDFF